MSRRWMTALGVLGTATLLAAQAKPPAATAAGNTVIFRNLAAFDPATGRTRTLEELVVVRGRVMAKKSTEPPADATVIDGAGKTAVPGLVDLAVGISPGRQVEADFVAALGLAHGVLHYVVTDARAPWAFDQQKRVSSGEVLSPTLSLAAPIIVSDPTSAPRSLDLSGYVPPIVVREPAEADAAVRRLANAGYDRIRVRGDVPTAVARAVVAAARKQRLRVSVVAGAASITEVAGWGANLIEGLGSVNARSQGKALDPADSWRQARPVDLAAIATRLAKSGVTLAPMLRATVRDVRGEKNNPLPFDPERGLALLPKRLQDSLGKGSSSGDRGDGTSRGALAALRSQQAFVKAWAAAGGKLGLASGISQEPWPVPGLAIHEELALLTAADIPVAPLLKVATSPDVDLPGTTRQWTDGWPANFFLVEGDPTQDLGALARITTVVRAGEVLSPESLLAQAKRAIR